MITLTAIERDSTNSASSPVFKGNLYNQRSEWRFHVSKCFQIEHGMGNKLWPAWAKAWPVIQRKNPKHLWPLQAEVSPGPAPTCRTEMKTWGLSLAQV